jgi:hypothetical protein
LLPRWREFQLSAAVFLAFLSLSSGLVVLRWTGRVGSRVFQAAAVIIIAADLFRFGFGYNAVVPASLIYPPRETVHFLQDDPELHRIITLSYSPALAANTGLVFRLTDAAGYNYTVPQRYVEFMAAANNGEPVMVTDRHIFLSDYQSPLLDLLNVKYVVTGAELWAPADVPDTAQPLADTTVALEQGQRYEQAVVVQNPGLHRIDVWLTKGQPAEGTLRLRLYTDPEGQEVAHAEVDISSAAGEPVSFYFSPMPNRLGRQFRFSVETATPETRASLQASNLGGLRFASYYAPYDNLVFDSPAEGTRIYLNEGYLPRAFVVHRTEVAPDGDAALARLADPNFDLRSIAVLEETPPPEHALSADAPTDEEETVEITDYQLNRVTLRTRTAAPGYLILAEANYPGWRATVDDQETHVYQADYVLRAIYLPPGTHEVRFLFQPASFALGAGVSATALVVCVGLLLYDARRQRLRQGRQMPCHQSR